jgi:hypothetical protein
VALKEVQPDDELMMITRNGVSFAHGGGIRVIGRKTPGSPGDEPGFGRRGWWNVARVVKDDEAGGAVGTGIGVEAPAAEGGCREKQRS